MLVVAGGLMMYLHEENETALFRRITEQSPSGQIAAGSRLRSGGYGDLEAFCFFIRSLLAAQYARMRSDIARRFAGVSRCFRSRRLGAGSSRFAAGVTLVCLDEGSEWADVDPFVANPLAGVGIGGAISMPNISERSSLASTFTPAGPLGFLERLEPAFAIKSC